MRLLVRPFFKFFVISFLVIYYFLSLAYAEPLVIIEYRNGDNYLSENSTNPFSLDTDYTTVHKVEPGDVLGGIIKQYYGGSGLDLRFVQLAIIAVNPKAFARANANYLFAGPTLTLPSVRQIQNLVVGISIDDEMNMTSGADLYFYGS